MSVELGGYIMGSVCEKSTRVKDGEKVCVYSLRLDSNIGQIINSRSVEEGKLKSDIVYDIISPRINTLSEESLTYSSEVFDFTKKQILEKREQNSARHFQRDKRSWMTLSMSADLADKVRGVAVKMDVRFDELISNELVQGISSV
jgi:hypothetical protein